MVWRILPCDVEAFGLWPAVVAKRGGGVSRWPMRQEEAFALRSWGWFVQSSGGD
jgi:hypothetical protein